MNLVYPQNKGWLAAAMALGVVACATPAHNGDDNGVRGESAPCADCRSNETVALSFSEARSYREWGTSVLRLDTSAPVGVLPVLRLGVPDPGDCSICHSFSADAVEFDFSSAQDSLLRSVLGLRNQVQLYPGMDVPERDSLLWRAWTDSLTAVSFVGGSALADFAPWRERSGEGLYARPVPTPLRSLLGRVTGRYGARYLALPLRIEVSLMPKAGKRGGYRWESLWTLWDARSGTLLVLDYRSFKAETTGAAPPDRQWSGPWAAELGVAMARGPRSDEPH